MTDTGTHHTAELNPLLVVSLGAGVGLVVGLLTASFVLAIVALNDWLLISPRARMMFRASRLAGDGGGGRADAGRPGGWADTSLDRRGPAAWAGGRDRGNADPSGPAADVPGETAATPGAGIDVATDDPPVLTIATWGGAYEQAQREALFEPFTAQTGVRIEVAEYDGGIDELHAQHGRLKEGGAVAWDLVDMTMSDTLTACREGLLRRLAHHGLPPSPDGQPARRDLINGALTLAAMADRGAPIEIFWDGQIQALENWAVAAGSRHPDAGMRVIRYATGRDAQTRFACHLPYGPTRRSASRRVAGHIGTDIDMQPHLPTHPVNDRNSIVKDVQWYASTHDRIREICRDWLDGRAPTGRQPGADRPRQGRAGRSGAAGRAQRSANP